MTLFGTQWLYFEAYVLYFWELSLICHSILYMWVDKWLTSNTDVNKGDQFAKEVVQLDTPNWRPCFYEMLVDHHKRAPIHNCRFPALSWKILIYFSWSVAVTVVLISLPLQTCYSSSATRTWSLEDCLITLCTRGLLPPKRILVWPSPSPHHHLHLQFQLQPSQPHLRLHRPLPS